MNKTLFAKELRANLFVSGIIAAVLAMYIGTIVAMYDPKLGESLDLMMQSMPELFAAFGMSMQATTLLEFMLNYLYGFLLTIFILVLILVMVNKLMVRYLDAQTSPTFCFVPFDILRMRRAGSSSKYSISCSMRVRSRSFFMRAMNSRNAAPVISSMQAISPGR